MRQADPGLYSGGGTTQETSAAMPWFQIVHPNTYRPFSQFLLQTVSWWFCQEGGKENCWHKIKIYNFLPVSQGLLGRFFSQTFLHFLSRGPHSPHFWPEIPFLGENFEKPKTKFNAPKVRDPTPRSSILKVQQVWPSWLSSVVRDLLRVTKWWQGE